MLLAGSQAVVFLGDPDDHWIDRAEAVCLEDQVRERIVGRRSPTYAGLFSRGKLPRNRVSSHPG